MVPATDKHHHIFNLCKEDISLTGHWTHFLVTFPCHKGLVSLVGGTTALFSNTAHTNANEGENQK